MVFLLNVVSFLLALGGGAAALFGADTIRTETGATLAVAGVAMTCAGLLMFALTACLSELRKIRRLVESGQAAHVGGPVPLPEPPPPAVPAVTAAAVAAAVVAADRTPAEAALRTQEPETAAEAGSEPGPATEPEAERLPAVSLPPVEVAEEPDAQTPEPPATTPTVPSIEGDAADAAERDPERPAHDPAAASAGENASASDSASTDARPEVEPAVAEPASDTAPMPVTAPAPVPALLPTLEERELVATYTSGENTYFMYSDNAIEAETPQGRFRFGSMEELRVFVETGTGGMPLAPPPPPRD